MINDTTILTTKKLVVGYNPENPLLSGLNLQLAKGQLTCLLGANGTGKSTLMRTLSGLLKPVSGESLLLGKNISSLKAKEKAKMLSLVFTQNMAPGNLTVYAMVSLGRFPYSGWMGNLSEEDKAIIDWALDITETVKFTDKHIDQLSDGERQKVVIARALAQDTSVIFLDEPTAHLDLPSRIEIFHLLRNLTKNEGKTVLMTTHHLGLALHQADQVWLINREGNFFQGIPEDLVLNGAVEQAFASKGLEFNPLTASFFKPGNLLKSISLKGEGIPYFWTKNALERAGFKVAENSALTVQVHSGNQLHWTLNKAETHFSTIEELLKTINKHL